MIARRKQGESNIRLQAALARAPEAGVRFNWILTL